MDIESRAYRSSLLAVSALSVIVYRHLGIDIKESCNSQPLSVPQETIISFTLLLENFLDSTLKTNLAELYPYLCFVDLHFVAKPVFSNIAEGKSAQVA